MMVINCDKNDNATMRLIFVKIFVMNIYSKKLSMGNIKWKTKKYWHKTMSSPHVPILLKNRILSVGDKKLSYICFLPMAPAEI